MTGPGGFGHTGPGGHTALDIPFRFEGECALCCPPACHSGYWCTTHLVLGLLMAPHYLYWTLPTTPLKPRQTAEEEKGGRLSPVFLFMLGRFGRKGPHCCCVRHAVQSYSHGEETGARAFFFFFSLFIFMEVFTVAQLLLGLLCNGSVERWWALPELSTFLYCFNTR